MSFGLHFNFTQMYYMILDRNLKIRVICVSNFYGSFFPLIFFKFNIAISFCRVDHWVQYMQKIFSSNINFSSG